VHGSYYRIFFRTKYHFHPITNIWEKEKTSRARQIGVTTALCRATSSRKPEPSGFCARWRATGVTGSLCRASSTGATNTACSAGSIGTTRVLCHATSSRKPEPPVFYARWRAAGVTERICRASTTGATKTACSAISLGAIGVLCRATSSRKPDPPGFRARSALLA
jgi:hypothetical protein